MVVNHYFWQCWYSRLRPSSLTLIHLPSIQPSNLKFKSHIKSKLKSRDEYRPKRVNSKTRSAVRISQCYLCNARFYTNSGTVKNILNSTKGYFIYVDLIFMIITLYHLQYNIIYIPRCKWKFRLIKVESAQNMQIKILKCLQISIFCDKYAIYTGSFIMFSVITNIYNQKTKGPTLMELFTATGKLNKFFDNYRWSMCAPWVKRLTSTRYSSSCHTHVCL
jgi:hypothetical protein